MKKLIGYLVKSEFTNLEGERKCNIDKLKIQGNDYQTKEYYKNKLEEKGCTNVTITLMDKICK